MIPKSWKRLMHSLRRLQAEKDGGTILSLARIDFLLWLRENMSEDKLKNILNLDCYNS